MDYTEVIDQITPEIYGNLKRAVELGKWPNGDRLTEAQRKNCIDAVIAWELRHRPEDQRTGYMPPKEQQKQEQAEKLANSEKPLSWK